MNRPLIIGITGSIASGKSEVVNYLNKSGFRVFSTDELGHQVLLLDEVKLSLVEKFGKDILDHNNLLDREKLSKLVFKDRANLDFLNSLSHPQIFKKMREIVEKSEEKFLLFEVPLLFEAKLEDRFDFIITVSTTPEIQLTRLMARNNLTREDAQRKISSQLSNEVKETKADFVINNNGSLSELQAKTAEVITNFNSIVAKNIIPF